MMEEQGALDREHRGGGREEGDERRAVVRPRPPGGRRRQADRREGSETEPREPEDDREVRVRGGDGDTPGGAADADGAVPQIAEAGGVGQEHRDGDGGGAGPHRRPSAARQPAAPGADEHRRGEGQREQLHQHGRRDQGARGRRSGRATGRREHGEGHQAEGDRRDVRAHHGGPVDDGRRQADEQGGHAAGQRAPQGPDDEGRGEDAAEAEQQHPGPHEGGVAPGRHRQGPQAHEEEGRLRGEHLGPQRRAVRQGDGAPQVDALVELGRVDRQPAPRGDGDEPEHEAEPERLGRVLRGPGAAAHGGPRYRGPGGTEGLLRRSFTASHRRGGRTVR